VACRAELPRLKDALGLTTSRAAPTRAGITTSPS
jgi:hypothetical protein